MTIEQVKQGIIDALFANMGASRKFHTENVNQDLDRPCLLVRCLNPSQAVDLGDRHSKSMLFAVQFFPTSDDTAQVECNNACDMMFDALENITADGQILHARDMSGQTSDGVLTFTVSYDLFFLTSETSVKMGDVAISVTAEERT